ncbi:MAG TPA: hypothetical protein P5056_02710 [Candidatus Paceibacterota bacterium]|nr:hypothetical protein [Candidatus Paceibacterota bacterium]
MSKLLNGSARSKNILKFNPDGKVAKLEEIAGRLNREAKEKFPGIDEKDLIVSSTGGKLTLHLKGERGRVL